LVEVGAAVDHALFVNGDAGGGAFEFGEAFGDVEFVQGSLGAGDGGRVVAVTARASRAAAPPALSRRSMLASVAWPALAPLTALLPVFFVEFVPAQHDVSSPA
jgi:hypothetical protein